MFSPLPGNRVRDERLETDGNDTPVINRSRVK